MFQDVTTLLLHPEAFQHSIDILYEHYKNLQVDVIAGTFLTTLTLLTLIRKSIRFVSSEPPLLGILDQSAGFEARGLIFGAPLALALKVPFVPLRKPGKLPGGPRHT